MFYLLVQPVGDSSGGRLVDDTQDIEARDGAGILGGLTLRVIEVGGYSDHSIVDSLKETNKH